MGAGGGRHAGIIPVASPPTRPRTCLRVDFRDASHPQPVGSRGVPSPARDRRPDGGAGGRARRGDPHDHGGWDPRGARGLLDPAQRGGRRPDGAGKRPARGRPGGGPAGDRLDRDSAQVPGAAVRRRPAAGEHLRGIPPGPLVGPISAPGGRIGTGVPPAAGGPRGRRRRPAPRLVPGAVRPGRGRAGPAADRDGGPSAGRRGWGARYGAVRARTVRRRQVDHPRRRGRTGAPGGLGGRPGPPAPDQDPGGGSRRATRRTTA